LYFQKDHSGEEGELKARVDVYKTVRRLLEDPLKK